MRFAPQASYRGAYRSARATAGCDIARDELLHHRPGPIGLRPRFRDPLVLAAFEHVQLAIAAGRLVSRGELFLSQAAHCRRAHPA